MIWIAAQLNECRDDVILHSPIIIQPMSDDPGHQIEQTIAVSWKRKAPVRHFLFPVWENDHWSGVEIQLGSDLVISMIAFKNHNTVQSICHAVKSFAERAGLQCHVCHCNITAGHNMCGWNIVTKWIPFFGDTIVWPMSDVGSKSGQMVERMAWGWATPALTPKTSSHLLWIISIACVGS